MKKLILGSLTLLLMSAGMVMANPPDKAWYTDAAQAQRVAREKKLPMLVLFTGSDWCGWCQRLEKETLTQAQFKRYIDGKVIPLYLDFPQNKQLSREMIQQNETWRRSYPVQGFPTILVLSPDGKEIGRLGYNKVDKFIEQLDAILKGRTSMNTTNNQPAADAARHSQYDNFNEALQVARDKNIPLVAMFGSSDTCPYCMRMKRDTLDSQKFQEFSGKEIIFCYVDFPKQKQLSQDLTRLNLALAEKFDIEAYPTTVVFDSQGRKKGEFVGFLGPDDYIAQIRQYSR